VSSCFSIVEIMALGESFVCGPVPAWERVNIVKAKLVFLPSQCDFSQFCSVRVCLSLTSYLWILIKAFLSMNSYYLNFCEGE
jgi:hypothetical protein